MNREQGLIHYLLAIAAYKKWLETGFITEREYRDIESLAAQRYRLASNSMYREMT